MNLQKKRENCYESEKSHPSGRAGTADRYLDQQPWRCINAAFRLWYFRYFQRPLCIFPCISGFDPWHLDLYLPGTSGPHPYGLKKAFRSQLSVQLCSWFRFWKNGGYPPDLGQYTAS